MTKTDIIDRVKTLLDENTPSGSGFLVGIIEDKPIESHIKSLLNPTWIEFGMVSPVHLLPSLTVESPLAATGTGIVLIPTPTGYLRTVNVSMPSWAREVMPVTADSPVYDHQKNTYTRGTKTRPVATLNSDGIKAYVGVEGEKARWKYVPIIDFDKLISNHRQTVTITVTYGAISGGKALVMLDNAVFSVPLTNSDGDETLSGTAYTASELATFAYTGWTATRVGSVVTLVRTVPVVMDAYYYSCLNNVQDDANFQATVSTSDVEVTPTTAVISDRLSEAFCCNVAANVYLVMKDQPTAAALMAKRDTMLQ